MYDNGCTIMAFRTIIWAIVKKYLFWRYNWKSEGKKRMWIKKTWQIVRKKMNFAREVQRSEQTEFVFWEWKNGSLGGRLWEDGMFCENKFRFAPTLPVRVSFREWKTSFWRRKGFKKAKNSVRYRFLKYDSMCDNFGQKTIILGLLYDHFSLKICQHIMQCRNEESKPARARFLNIGFRSEVNTTALMTIQIGRSWSRLL